MGGGNRRRSSSEGSSPVQLIVVAVAIVLVIVSPIIAQMIYFAISRKREYLADASSAQYTRYPEGLASALEKLATSNTRVRNVNKATAPMYTADPLREKAELSSDLMSTHPALTERVRILRSMGGASYVDYDRAYQEVRHSRGIVPASALAGAGSIEKREAAAAEAPGTDSSLEERHRETSDLMWRLSDYRTVTCRNCSTRIRLPPTFEPKAVRCPHCGTVNPV